MSTLNANAVSWEPPGFKAPDGADPSEEPVAVDDWDEDDLPQENGVEEESEQKGVEPAPEPVAPEPEEEPVAPEPEEEPVAPEPEEESVAPEPEEEPVAPEPVAPKKQPTPKVSPKVSPKTSKKSKKKEAAESKHNSVLVHDEREHLNIVFIGHVDAGKSTISGQVLYSTGQVDDRTIEKFKKLAKDHNRESWWMAYLLDTDEEERAKGKTVEVGRAHFDTPKKRYTILDAPGHKNYVPAMIQGAAQADVGILVISARRNEFEAGFDRQGQTREHAMLAKTLGISKLVIVVNKMDDESVKWSKDRYDFCVEGLLPFLKTNCGFNIKKDIVVLPLSGLTGANLAEPVSTDICPWYGGQSLFQTLDSLKSMKRDADAALRVPLVDKYKDMGCVIAMGKVESGTLFKGQKLTVVPRGMNVECVGISVDEKDVDCARCGENVNIVLKNCDLNDIHGGDVLSDCNSVCSSVKEFECQMAVLDLLLHKPLLSSGYQCVLHCHAMSVDCEIMELLTQSSRKTGKKKKKPTFVRSNSTVSCLIRCASSVALERYKSFPQLGRFTLRDEGKTIAIGKITKLSSTKSEDSKNGSKSGKST